MGEQREVTINNHRKSENLVIIFLIVIYIILFKGLNVRSVILDIPFIAIAFFFFYFIILFGLKIFKIKKISGNKITIYILSVPIVSKLALGLINSIVVGVLLNNIISYTIYCFFTFLFFRYYLLLSIKQVLQLFLYLTFSWIILLKIVGYLLPFPA